MERPFLADNEDSDRRACPQDHASLWTLVPFVKRTTVAAVLALDNPLHALALRHERSHPSDRPTVKLRVLVAASGFFDLSQEAKRNLGGVSAFLAGAGKDGILGMFEGSARVRFEGQLKVSAG